MRNAEKRVTGCVVVGLALAAAGCSADAVSEEPVASTSQELVTDLSPRRCWNNTAGVGSGTTGFTRAGSIQPFGNWNESAWNDFDGGAAPNFSGQLTEAQVRGAKARARKVLAYLLGGAMPTDAELGPATINASAQNAQAGEDRLKRLKWDMCAARNAIADGIYTLTNRGQADTSLTCGLPTTVVTVEGIIPVPLPSSIVNNCAAWFQAGNVNQPGSSNYYGGTANYSATNNLRQIDWSLKAKSNWDHRYPNAPTFFLMKTNFDGASADIDPGPAKLDNGSALSASAGSTAAAAWTEDPTQAPTTAFYVPPAWVPASSYGSPPAGAPCNAGPTSAGATVYGEVQVMLSNPSRIRCVLY